jgi:hypothetical protein
MGTSPWFPQAETATVAAEAMAATIRPRLLRSPGGRGHGCYDQAMAATIARRQRPLKPLERWRLHRDRLVLRGLGTLRGECRALDDDGSADVRHGPARGLLGARHVLLGDAVGFRVENGKDYE